MSLRKQKVLKIYESWWILEDMYDFKVITSSADALVPLGAIASAGTVMTNLHPYVCVNIVEQFPVYC